MSAILSKPLNVLAVPAFEDNYLWLIHNDSHAAVVDPGDAAPILRVLENHQLTLSAILLTHHHRDHTGGVADLLQRFDVPVFGPRNESITAVKQPISEGDSVFIPELDLHLAVLDVPGHTRGHIAYVAHEQGWLFCGDTLFGGGCGRLFEGTPAQMTNSLGKLAVLPDDMQVYCAHEYTLSNLRFALEVEPENPALIKRMQDEQAKRQLGMATVPSTIGLEKATNPFLRYREPAIAKQLMDAGKLDQDTPVAVFAALREWKNSYR